MEPFTRTLDWQPPFARWFEDGKLNVSDNCLDRHVEAGLGEKVAYHWIGEPGDTRTLTYADLHREVQKAANALLELGIRTGDRVAIYMPMIPELPIAMLACARIGAPHTVVFGGFSAEALASRINDAQARLLITADGGWRRGKVVDLKSAADEALDAHDHRRARARGQACRRRGTRDHAGRSRRLVARDRGAPGPRLPAAGARCRAHALPALHLGHDGQAQGHHAHHGRLPAWRQRQPRAGLRHQARRRLLVCGRHRLGDRALLHRLRAAGQRAPPASCTRAPRTRRPGSAGGRSSRSTGSPSCTRRRRPSGPS